MSGDGAAETSLKLEVPVEEFRDRGEIEPVVTGGLKEKKRNQIGFGSLGKKREGEE